MSATLDNPKRAKPKPKVRGGFIIHRRGDSTSKLRTPPNHNVFEHGSLEEAKAEAERLAALHGREFTVFQEVAAALPTARHSEAA